ncbi:MAG TPA: flagellar biosynthesis protein FlgL [Xanthobacteraceae bacterium]|jgi:flagellar hook-associated protein 3 FlgL|nr:flagellar biosynthesis protein FlgL [Xanthobacteraceae bacterium]
MSITGPGSVTAAQIVAQNNMMDQVNKLAEELATGQSAQVYSDLQSQAGMVLSLNSQLAAINGYSSTTSTVNTTLGVAQSILTELGSTSSTVQQEVTAQPGFSLNANGQTQVQVAAQTQLDQILSALNTQSGSNYIFSGSAVNQPAVASTSDILNGTGTQAGLTQIISEREQADQGTTGMGRLSVATTGSTVTLSQDGTPFGFQLTGVNSSLTGATTTGPSGTPPTISVALGSNPNDGDTISFQLTLPDGSTQNVSLQATTASPPGTGQFSIGATAADTATNLQNALSSTISNLAQTALPAASAMAAGNDFFQDPPQIVVPGAGNNYAAATSLTNGTAANTVIWYTGENGSTPARQTQTALIGPSTTIDYGMRANEQAITNLVKNVAVLAATTYSASNTNAKASYEALSQKVEVNLNPVSGTQSISDIESDLANAQITVTNTTKLNTQTQTTLNDILQNVDGVNQNNVGEQLLTLQNSLSASLSVSARIAQLSLVNYLSPSAG